VDNTDEFMFVGNIKNINHNNININNINHNISNINKNIINIYYHYYYSY